MRKWRSPAASGAALLALLLSGVSCADAEQPPAWMRVVADVVLLRDPLQAQAIRRIPGAPRIPAPRCVLEGYGNAPLRKCWAETRAASPLFTRATLSYARERSGSAPALYGTLELELAPQPCTRPVEAERVFERPFHPLPGGEPLAGAPPGEAVRHEARLFGAGMQPLTLLLDTAAGCITRATLVRG